LNNVQITSERFVLRELTPVDATPVYLNWLSDRNANQYISYAAEKRSLTDLASYINEKISKPNTLFLGIFLKESLLHIGNIKYEPVDVENGVALLGIMIGDSQWRGKGVASEVIINSAKWLSTNKKIRKIILGVDINNKAAIRAYEKVGFKVGTSDFIYINEEIYSTMIWKIDD
jgi:RimJ/RimL family protein N-acetyltransferase